jgi:abhydrolase domain-containing protein 6
MSTEITVATRRGSLTALRSGTPGGPKLLALHGWLDNAASFVPLQSHLSAFDLVALDLPGHGGSAHRARGYDYVFVDWIHDVLDALDALGWERATLLGHSMGGGIAALVAARHPQLVQRVALLDAAGVRFDDNQFGIDVLAGQNPFAVSDAQTLRRYIDTVFHRPQAKPWIPWPASRGFIARRRSDAAFEQSVLDRIGRGPEQFVPGEEAANIHQPALLLWGRQDVVIDPSALDLYAAKMPQARRLLVDDAGHMSLVEQPDAVAAAVVALIQQGHAR